MEDRHRCKLCFRSFASGRALGGHMRSHLMKMCASKQRELEQEEEEDDHLMSDSHSYSLPSSSSSDEDDEPEVKAAARYEVEENPIKNPVELDNEFSLQDRESETESSRRTPICRRSKRVRKSRNSDFDRFAVDAFFQAKKPKFTKETDEMETEPLSSISDTTPEEHVAHCLIMLSRDKWTRQEEEEEEVMGKTTATTKVRGKYRCETCNKVFRSYQALGGHRASHNKVKVNAPEKTGNNSGSRQAEEKTHECPFCHRIFSSGQALGGHKRSHFAAGGGAISIKSDGGPASSRTGEVILDIDLNLPAPTDDEESSQVDVSAVSDAEFVR